MNSEKDKIIRDLKESIKDTNRNMEVVRNAEVKCVTKDEWIKLCKTPLRYSDMILNITMETFPFGESFKRTSNFISFDYGELVVYISLNSNDVERPISILSKGGIDRRIVTHSFNPSRNLDRMRNYLSLKNQKNVDWKLLLKIRFGHIPMYKLLFKRLVNGRADIDFIKERIKKEDEKNYNNAKCYIQKREEVLDRIKTYKDLVDKLDGWGDIYTQDEWKCLEEELEELKEHSNKLLEKIKIYELENEWDYEE